MGTASRGAVRATAGAGNGRLGLREKTIVQMQVHERQNPAYVFH